MTPERYQRLCTTLNQRQPDLTVITDDVHKQHNVSAIVRTCDSVGIGDVHAVWQHPEYRCLRYTASGSDHWVNIHTHDDIVGGIKTLKSRGFQVVAAHFSETAISYHQVDYTKPTALLLGAEKFGVSDTAANQVDAHITIPMMGMTTSLNVSVAAAIILSEARKQRAEMGMYKERRLSTAEYDQLLFQWAHPKVAEYCRTHNLPFPPVREDDGEIDPSINWRQPELLP